MVTGVQGGQGVRMAASIDMLKHYGGVRDWVYGKRE